MRKNLESKMLKEEMVPETIVVVRLGKDVAKIRLYTNNVFNLIRTELEVIEENRSNEANLEGLFNIFLNHDRISTIVNMLKINRGYSATEALEYVYNVVKGLEDCTSNEFEVSIKTIDEGLRL